MKLRQIILQLHVTVCVVAAVYAVVSMPWWQVMLCVLTAEIVIGGIVSAYYHRCLSHNSWQCPAWAQIVFLWAGSGVTFMSAFLYAIIHLKHHRHSDTALDPHGPHLGLRHNIMVGFFEIDPTYANRRLVTNKLVMWQHKYLLWLAVSATLLWLAIWGWQSYVITVAYFHICTFFSNNFVGHTVSMGPMDRPYLSCINGSEFNHASHHRNPCMARFGRFDLPYLMYIRPLNKAKAREVIY